MVNGFRAGEVFNLRKLEYRQRESFVFWIKTKKDFDRQIQLNLQAMIKAYLYRT